MNGFYYYFFNDEKRLRHFNGSGTPPKEIASVFYKIKELKDDDGVYDLENGKISKNKETIEVEFEKVKTQKQKEMFVNAIEACLRDKRYQYEKKECETGSIYYYFIDGSDITIRLSNHPGHGYPINFRYDLHSEKYTYKQAKQLVERAIINTVNAKARARVKRILGM